MIDWIHAINWPLVIGITMGGLAGGEFHRYRKMKAGEQVSILPFWAHSVACATICFSAILFYETAKVALQMPSRFQVWMLIAVTVAAFGNIGFFSQLELKLTRQALRNADKLP